VGDSLALSPTDVAPIAPKLSKKALAGQALSLAGKTSSEDAPVVMSDALDNAYATAKQGASKAFGDIGIDATTPAPTQPLKDSITSYVDGLAKADKSSVPQGVLDDVSNLAENEPLNEIQAIRSKITGLASKASRSGDANEARILNGLNDIVSEHANTPSLSGLTDEQSAAYQQARSGYKEFKDTFNQPAVRAALGSDKYGFDKVPVSAIADNFIKPATQKGAPEAFNGYLNALSKATPDAQDLGMDAARTAFSDKFNSVLSKGSTAAVKDFSKNYSHVINSPLLTDAQRQIVQDVSGSVLKSNQATSGRLIGLLKNRLITGAIGSAIGGEEGGWRGALEGAGAGVGLTTYLRNAPANQVSGLISKSLTDPELANTLRMSIPDLNKAILSPSIQNTILSVLKNPNLQASTTVSATSAIGH
jgi:hypothetical protein